ncbi:DUF1364 family protein [Marinobacter salarius]|uniref:nuclease domain-containing protein n=1 Tax=Marinobacter salarius TaxID=1420917 RepID=UPI0022B1B53D|nr:nuclease domain-containing protein [Marinobacter salarius]MCZ4284567.1 DUF1364 family protein [Marinobacter salarius]
MKRTPIKRKTPLKAKAPMKKASRPKMTPIRKSAKGQECQVRVPGVCNGDSSTTVLAHLNGGGMGAKASDHEAAFSCSACHEWLDGGFARTGYNRDIRDLWHLQAVIRTQRILIEQGLMEVAA